MYGAADGEFTAPNPMKEPPTRREPNDVIMSSYALRNSSLHCDPSIIVKGMKQHSPLVTAGYDITSGNHDGMHSIGNARQAVIEVRWQGKIDSPQRLAEH